MAMGGKNVPVEVTKVFARYARGFWDNLFVVEGKMVGADQQQATLMTGTIADIDDIADSDPMKPYAKSVVRRTDGRCTYLAEDRQAVTQKIAMTLR